MHLKAAARAGTLAAILAVLALSLLPVRAETSAASGPAIRVTGTGEASVRPDRARVSSGVVTEAETARAALDANSEATARAIAALREAGIEDRDIRTDAFSVEPRYHYPDGRSSTPEAPRIVGYSVTNTVSVLVRDLESLGQILDRMVEAGANRVGGIALEVSDADRRLDDARAEAVNDARRKAELYARAAGVTLGTVISLDEISRDSPPRPMYARAMRAEMMDASVPIETGEQTLRVTVAIAWAIAP